MPARPAIHRMPRRWPVLGPLMATETLGSPRRRPLVGQRPASVPQLQRAERGAQDHYESDCIGLGKAEVAGGIEYSYTERRAVDERAHYIGRASGSTLYSFKHVDDCEGLKTCHKREQPS